MLWVLVLLFSLPLIRPQSIHSSLSLNTPLSLSANNFSSSTPLLFSLPSSSQLTISVALCAPPSSSPPRVFVSNSSDSQVIPGPNGGPDVFEVILGSLGLGNLTLDAGDTTGVLTVYGGATSDGLEIGVSQGGKATNPPRPSPPLELILMTDSTPPRAPRKPALLRRLHCERSSPLLPTLLPTLAVPTNIPELYPPASQHDAPVFPATI